MSWSLVGLNGPAVEGLHDYAASFDTISQI